MMEKWHLWKFYPCIDSQVPGLTWCAWRLAFTEYICYSPVEKICSSGDQFRLLWRIQIGWDWLGPIGLTEFSGSTRIDLNCLKFVTIYSVNVWNQAGSATICLVHSRLAGAGWDHPHRIKPTNQILKTCHFVWSVFSWLIYSSSLRFLKIFGEMVEHVIFHLGTAYILYYSRRNLYGMLQKVLVL